MIIQHRSITGDPALVPKKPADPPLPPAPDSMELRIRRLEEAVAGLQDTKQIEERVVERVSDKLSRVSNSGFQESPSFLREAGRHILPSALGIAAESVTSADSRKHSGASPRRAWWLFEAYDDLRAMTRMYSDYRYRRHMTWTAFLTPFVFVACILLVWFWMPTSIPVLGTLLDKVVDVLLAFFAYKILSRELIRYRDMLAGYSR